MAAVYLAEDLKHHRKVGVKVLRPELAAVLGAERFLKEIEVTANLQQNRLQRTALRAAAEPERQGRTRRQGYLSGWTENPYDT